MTKYILHGGETDITIENNIKFFNEILKDLNSPHVLIIYYARNKSEWETLLEEDTPKFTNTNKDTIIELANEDSSIVSEQIQRSDVVYIRGGMTTNLYNMLQLITEFKTLIKNKVVVGSSAGAYVLSKYFYSNGLKQIFEGMGVLPIKVIAHYSKELENIYMKLDEYKEKLPLYALPEAEYVVINI